MVDTARRSRRADVDHIVAEGVSDAELVERALAGDRWARDAIFRRHIVAVTQVVVRLLGRRDEAQDVVQDTLAQAFLELGRLRNPEALRPWILKIAVRKLHRIFRKRKLLRLFGFTSIDDPSLASLAEQSASPEVRAELGLLDRALAELPAQERIAWMLRYVEGEELRDVAEILGCSLATAKRRIRAANERVSKHVAIEEGEP